MPYRGSFYHLHRWKYLGEYGLYVWWNTKKKKKIMSYLVSINTMKYVSFITIIEIMPVDKTTFKFQRVIYNAFWNITVN